MNRALPPLRLAKLNTAPPTSANVERTSDQPTYGSYSAESGFSVNIDTPAGTSSPSPSVEDLSPRGDQRFQHAQDSFRQLIHRKSHQASANVTNPGRRHSTDAVSVLTRRESMRPRSLYDAQDSMREMIRRHSLRRGTAKRRWSLPGDTKATTRVHVTSTTSPGPSLQSLRVAASSPSDKCTIL